LLKAGLFARTRIVFSKRENALVVPEEALVPQAGKQYIFKVIDGPNGKVANRIEARIGLRLPGKVEVLEGLSVGDLVVTAGQARLGRGEPVPLRVVDISRPPGPGPGAGRPGGNGNKPANGASAPRPPSP
jgi:membrane fusion protein (multidrug efflux system)